MSTDSPRGTLIDCVVAALAGLSFLATLVVVFVVVGGIE